MAARFVTTSLHASLHQDDKTCMHHSTVREFALKVDSGRKIPYLTRESNPRQYCVWLLGSMLYPLSDPAP